jgi:hypothetical protein
MWSISGLGTSAFGSTVYPERSEGSAERPVWFETLASKREAAQRERQIKGWSRAKRVALIQAMNPNWIDLSMTRTEALSLE